ncbi:uncharacterized protein TNCV_445871 [Trichonephila clavipes]|nr:uncharacterized protein TNCV_445871 [Trichonephila clavipes]
MLMGCRGFRCLQIGRYSMDKTKEKVEITDFVRSIPGFQECDEADVDTWMECEFKMLNDGEIVTFVQDESDPVDDEMDEDEDNNNIESSKGLSNAEVFSAL